MADALPPIPGDVAPGTIDRVLAVISHLSVFISLPFLLPLIVYLVKRDSPYVRGNAREALNFHLTLIPLAIIAFLLIFVVIGFVLLPLLGLAAALLAIIAAIRACDGGVYRYPFCFRFLS